MLIAINKAHYPVTVLGPGQRIGIWFQGCRIHCPGCVSQDTWAADPGKRMPLHELKIDKGFVQAGALDRQAIDAMMSGNEAG